MTDAARGTFEVTMKPQESDPQSIGRMLLEKQFHGDLEASSLGQMLAERTPVKGSAGYVAMERVKGILHGRAGSFVLQHFATMNRGVPEQTVVVIPDSGTGELTGLSGKMKIVVAEGKHSYEFEYTITGKPV